MRLYSFKVIQALGSLFRGTVGLSAGFAYVLSSHPGFAQPVSQGFSLALNPQTALGLTQKQRAAIELFFIDAQLRLPKKMRESLARQVEVNFKDLGRTPENAPPLFADCALNTELSESPTQSGAKQWPKTRVAGGTIKPSDDLTQAHQIWLNGGFLPEIVQGEAQSPAFACGHRNRYRLAMATLLHEISHVYDFANLHTPQERIRFTKPCAQHGQVEGGDGDAHCGEILNRTLSKLPLVQTLLGSVEEGSINPTRREGEVVSIRSPDLYEFKDTDEGLAVNLEYFLMDPQYACRRPTLHQFFVQHFEIDPFPHRSCTVHYEVPISTAAITGEVAPFVNLDPTRLYQVHYLFASQGEDMMSRWGHSMFRLVFCSPEHPVPGPECLKDISYHVVVSFRANITGVTLNSLSGLDGAYPSQEYLMSLVDVLQEYTSDDLRDLISLPLNLTAAQKQSFLEKSISMYWEYKGRYFFISNNCATEALNLLKSISDDDQLQASHTLSPLGLYDLLAGLDLMDTAPLLDKKAAMAAGYLFESERNRLTSSFQEIAALDDQPAYRDLDHYIQASTGSGRMAWYKKLSATLLPDQQKTLAARFFIIETYLTKQKQSAFFNKIGELLDTGKTNHIDSQSDILKQVAQAQVLQRELDPHRLLLGGYGIPLPEDYQPKAQSDTAGVRSEWAGLTADLKVFLQKHFVLQYEELTRAAQNRKDFAHAMSQSSDERLK